MFSTRGTLLHELWNLPHFWLRMWKAGTPSSTAWRIPYGRHSRQYFLYFQPVNKAPDRKLIVLYIHGGGWLFASPEAFKPHAGVFLDAGYPVIFPSFRRIPLYDFDDMREDLNLLLIRLRRLWRERDWTGRRLIAGGMSSGGHLAAHLALNHRALDICGWEPSDIAGLLCCGAPLDLDRMRLTPVVRAMAGPRHSKRYRRANPVGLIGEPLPSTLIVHGPQDGLVSIDSARSFAERLLPHSNASSQFYVIPNGTHLDAASWGHTDNNVREVILEWISKYCT